MAKAAEKAPAIEPTEEAAPPKKGKGKLLVMLVAVLLLAGGGGGGAAWFLLGGKSDAKEKKAPPPKAPVYHPLEQFTVNLQPEGDEQYLQISMTLKVGEQKVVEHLKQHDPELRNRFLLILTSKAPSQLTSIEGKRLLAEEILHAARRPFSEGQPDQEVQDVVFTAFIIQ
ncbi:Flagellar protein LafL [Burkholderiales bacterium]|nr:MAG: flagellar basal body-associated protein FliL [Burkholderiales bacterium]CAG0964417.1 Flagellar protein LafL [Burkholderiales bacterium]